MKIIETVEVSFLWKKNKFLPWMKHLQNIKEGRDFETIKFWENQFNTGKETTLVVDCNYIVTDGRHRLVASKNCRFKEINVVVCPQRSSYGI